MRTLTFNGDKTHTHTTKERKREREVEKEREKRDLRGGGGIRLWFKIVSNQ